MENAQGMLNLGDWLARRERLTPDKVALVDTLNAHQPITYRAWNRAANRTANFLRKELGVQPGDRVAVLAMNCMEYLNVWFACAKLGAILQALNWRLTPRELAALLDDATPRVLLYGLDFAAQAASLQTHTGHQPAHFVPFDEHYQAQVAQVAETPPPAVALDWDTPWVICYTGGTTGLPKGALLTYRSITANAVNTNSSWGLTAADIAILNAPLFHTGGLNVFTAPLVHCGGTSILCRAFDANQTFDLIREAGVSVFFGVPTMFITLQQHPRWAEADFSRLKLVISGGAACPLPVFEKFWARGVDFKTGYGLTEAGPNNFYLPPEEVRRKPGAVGFPLFHVDVRLVNPTTGQACEPNEVGELWLRGPHVFAGYWQHPAETTAALAEGWLHTGDLAQCDADGCYTIVGRVKDMIISGGENIYPAEVESVLAAHPVVAEAALIGVPDEKWGEVGRAVVVAHAGATLNEAALIAFCRDRLAKYKTPKSVVFVADLPKTGAGKVDKKILVEKYGK